MARTSTSENHGTTLMSVYYTRAEYILVAYRESALTQRTLTLPVSTQMQNQNVVQSVITCS